MSSIYSKGDEFEIKPHEYFNGVPIFKPSMDEFKDFYVFNKCINKYGMKSGIVKIIPPNEWKESISKIYNKKNIERVKIKNPIIQHMNACGNGIFSLQNVERSRTYNIYQWKKLSEKSNFKTPLITNRSKNETIKKNDDPDEIHKIDTSVYTDEICNKLERKYWKTLKYAMPMYGADLIGTLFDDSIDVWNISSLPSILDLMTSQLPGINKSYVYAGLWKATFSWHLEDQDLYSINYIHFGAPKQWFLIPQEYSTTFFNLMKDIFYDEFKNCPEFLRHKTFNLSPQFIEKKGIKCNKIVHYEGEIIITYPYGYHSGFNYGYNFAESVNFALDDWFPLGFKTKRCECINDSVLLDFKKLFLDYYKIPYDENFVLNEEIIDQIRENFLLK